MRRGVFILAATAVAASCAPSAPNVSDAAPSDGGLTPPRCVPERSIACACSSGLMGAQTCNTEGTYEACSCDIPDAGVCDPGTVDHACVCDDGRVGSRSCLSGLWRECVCPYVDGGHACLWGELCNGLDDDCDGAVDEAETCPPGPIVGTRDVPTEVFALMAPRSTACARSFDRVWPAEGESIPTPVDPGTAWCSRTGAATIAPDGRAELELGGHILAHDATGDVLVSDAAACLGSGVDAIAFDAAGRRYYSCIGFVYRDDVIHARGRLVGVLAGGETLVTRPDLTVLDADGRELSRIDEHVLGVGLSLPGPATIAGASAFVAIIRVAPTFAHPEVVSLRVDPDGTYEIVRRASVDSPYLGSPLALPDGTFVFLRQDPVDGYPFTEIVALLPDGAFRTLFRSVDSVELGPLGLLVSVAP